MSLCIHNRQEMSSEIYCITYYVRTKLHYNVDSRLKKRLIVAEFRCVSSKKVHTNAENTVTYWDRGNTSDISGTKFEWLCFHPWTDNFQFFQFFCENIDQNLKPSQFI